MIVEELWTIMRWRINESRLYENARVLFEICGEIQVTDRLTCHWTNASSGGTEFRPER